MGSRVFNLGGYSDREVKVTTFLRLELRIKVCVYSYTSTLPYTSNKHLDSFTVLFY